MYRLFGSITTRHQKEGKYEKTDSKHIYSIIVLVVANRRNGDKSGESRSCLLDMRLAW
jgi:hypothetical protein